MKRKLQFWLGRIIVVLLLAPLTVWAESGQFYFLARTAPVGSLSAPGQTQEGVYLRWDALEGELPGDVDQLRLLRDGETLLEVGANEVMPEARIAALYQGAAQQRRLLETVTQLQEAQVGAGQSFNPNGFAGLVHDRLVSDTGVDKNWAFLASRSDVNIARARYRGYFDQPGRGEFTYELLAVDAAGITARLGRAVVDTTSPRQVQAPNRFEQVTQARCDAPEYAKDHYTVTLDWSAPGAGLVTDRLASRLFISGYDLYRTTDNLDISVDEAPVRDIADLAASADHDSRGQVQIDGLEKVNDVLLTLSPDDNDQSPEWLETHEDLRNAGLEPGDHRAYYLVPRDFTGHYGPTIGTMVTVPNLTRPAKPWDVRVFADNSPDDPDKNIALSFDRVTLRNYLDLYEDNYRICNRDMAAQTGVLNYVGKNESCLEDTRRSLRLDVTDYKIYRFESFEAASQFRDSDGDGVADADERDLGMQCDPGAQPASAESALVETTDTNPSVETLPNSGRERVRFRDTVPASETNRETGRVFWYRLAAQTADKRLSLLTSPQRALFPERELPDKPLLTAERSNDYLCGCTIESTVTTDPWDFIDDLKEPGTTALSCDGQVFSSQEPDALQSGGQLCGDAKVALNCDGAASQALGFTSERSARIGGFSCQAELPAGVDICNSGQVRLKPDYCEARTDLEGLGSVIAGNLELTVVAPDADSCVSLFRDVDGNQTRVATSCGTEVPGQIEYTADKGLFCGYAVTHDGNNNVSLPTEVPCTLIRPEGQKAPGTPQTVSVDITDTTADVRWRLPVEPVAATLIEFRNIDADGERHVTLTSVPAAGLGSGEVQEHLESISPLSGAEEEWCIRLRAVSPATVDSDSQASSWSAPRCVTRSGSPVAPPEYLPWPSQSAVPQGSDLNARLGIEFMLTDRTGPEIFNILVDLTEVEGLETSCYIQDYNPTEETYKQFPEFQCTPTGKGRAKAAIDPHLNFVAYRQGRAPDGTLEDWIQVSPLIDFVHWDSIPIDDKLQKSTQLNDPYIKLYDRLGQFDRWGAAFIDRYPYIGGHEYRYQFLYFTEDHRLGRWRQSNWLVADPVDYLSALQQQQEAQ